MCYEVIAQKAGLELQNCSRCLTTILPVVRIPLGTVLKIVVVVDKQLCPGLQRLQGDHAPDAAVERMEEVTEPSDRGKFSSDF